MRNKVKRVSPEVTVTRVMDALVRELVDVSDEEIVDAAKSLGMDLSMKESAAFAGLTYPARPQLSDFFELEAYRRLQSPTDPSTPGPAATPKRKPQS